MTGAGDHLDNEKINNPNRLVSRDTSNTGRNKYVDAGRISYDE